MVLLSLMKSLNTIPWAMCGGRQRWPDLFVSAPHCWGCLFPHPAGWGVRTAQSAKHLLLPWLLTGPLNCWVSILVSPEVPALCSAMNKFSSFGLYVSARPFYKLQLGNSASFLGIFTLSNCLHSTKIPHWILGSYTWWEELHPATLNCPNASKFFQAPHEKPQPGDLTALTYLYDLGVMSQDLFCNSLGWTSSAHKAARQLCTVFWWL